MSKSAFQQVQEKLMREKEKHEKYLKDNPFEVVQEVEQPQYGFKSCIVRAGSQFIVVKMFKSGKVKTETFSKLYDAEMRSTYGNK